MAAQPPPPPVRPPGAPAIPAQPPTGGAGSNAIPWGPAGIVPPTTSLTAPAVGDRSGFTSGLLPNSASATGPFPNPAPGSMPPTAQVPQGTKLPVGSGECVPFEVPQSMTGVQSAYVLGCIQVAAGQWACSSDQLASPVSAPACSIPRIQPHCSTSPLAIPPPTPGSASIALLGCLASGSKDDAAFKCPLAMPASANGAPGNEGAGSGICLMERPPLPPPPTEEDGGEQDESSVVASGAGGMKGSIFVIGLWVIVIAQLVGSRW